MVGERAEMPTTSTPATAMRYRDVATAADWLCSAFGFEKQTVLKDDDAAPLYVQLTCGRAMLMLAPVRPSPIDRLMKQPDEIGGAETQSGYYVVSDADAHCARAKTAGAAIILDVEDDDFGGRAYTCRDPEGHIWTFGTYDPWQGKFPEPAAPPPAVGGVRRLMRIVLTLAVMSGAAVAGWYGGALTQSSAVSSTGQPHASAALERRAALEAAEQAARRALVQLDSERASRIAADKASEQAQQRLAQEQQAREGAERAVKEARAELERERTAKSAAAAGSADILKRIEEESRAREAAERAVREARAELEKAQADKTAAEMAKDFALGRAEEEQAAREAAERAAKEARAALERKQAADATVPGGPPASVLKGSAGMQRALDEARKRAADAQTAREAAERAVKEAREQLAKVQASKAAAWKVVGQLTKQLRLAKGATGASAANDGDPPAPAKKARPRPKKKAAEPDQ
jgi:uncharacterized glyoxalase superfamily protein PhnB